MSQLAKHLIDRGAVSAEQLKAAAHSKAIYGGRLGTNLVETGALSEAELAAHLGSIHGVDPAPRNWLEAPDPRALKLIPLPLVRRYKILPLRLDDQTLHIATRDPHQRGELDEIARVSRRSVAAYVLPELELFEWLERHLGIDRHPRYARHRPEPTAPKGTVSAQTIEALGGGEELIDAELFHGLHARVGDPGGAGARDESSADDELLLEELVAESGARDETSDLLGAPPHDPADTVALEAELATAADRDTIVSTALRLARAHARVAALFLVQNGMVAGLRGCGEGLDEGIGAILIPTETESVFALPASDGIPYRGRPPENGIDGRLLSALGRSDAVEILVQPVVIRGRVVSLLYADNGADPLAETSAAALAALGECVAQAFERLILERRRRAS